MKLAKVVCFVAVLLVMAFAPMALAQGTYTQIDVPAAVYTVTDAINTAGDVVGYYSDSGGGLHSFLLSGGIFTFLDVPGAQFTQACGINDVGQIVGFTDTNGFLYDIATQTFTTLQYPQGGRRTIALSINNAGTIVGDILGRGDGEFVGFELNNGIYTIIKAPGADQTSIASINNLDEALVVGVNNSSGLSIYYLLNQGKLTKLSGSAGLYPTSINDGGAITGYYRIEFQPSSSGRDNTRNEPPLPSRPRFIIAGFVKQDNLRTRLRFNHSIVTFGLGINNSGMVAGSFQSHGFIWTPPADAAKK